jgi:broad specificity phosphatase PhoE
MSDLYLIRHGQASFGKDNYDRLSPLGIRQAGILGRHLLSTGLRFDAAYSGTMDRQSSTAMGVFQCYTDAGEPVPELVQLGGLNEYDTTAVVSAQVPDMMAADPTLKDDLEQMYTDKESFKRVFEGAMLRWVSGNHDKPGSESWKHFTSRVSDALQDIMKSHGSGSSVAVFTSGGPICAALKWVLNLSGERAIRLNWQVVNTSYSRFMYNGERITLAGFNNISHLELHNEYSLITYR